jgi:hypothetical protein
MIKTNEPPDDDWGKYQKLVLSKLENIEESAEKLDARLRSVEIELVMLRVKSSFWGGVAGLGAFAATWVIQWIGRKP